MAYDDDQLINIAIHAIKKHNIRSIDEVVVYLPCCRKTFYRKELHKSSLLRDLIYHCKLRDKKDKYNESFKFDSIYKKISKGYVYIVQYNNENLYKIGVSKNTPYLRLSSLQSGCPYELKFIHIEFCDNYYDLEKKLHLKYIKFRIRGEWFKLSDKELNKLISSIEKNKATQLSLF